jgi:hypothetical protein
LVSCYVYSQCQIAGTTCTSHFNSHEKRMFLIDRPHNSLGLPPLLSSKMEDVERIDREETTSQSGYLADSESSQSPDSIEKTLSQHQADPTAALSSPGDMVILGKANFSSCGKQQRFGVAKYHQPRPYRSRKIDDSSRWIERVYSNTPFAAPNEFNHSPMPKRRDIKSQTPSCIRWNTEGCHNHHSSRNVRNHKYASKIAAQEEHDTMSSADGEGSIYSAGSLMNGLNADTVDDDILTSTLVDVVQALLLDSHAMQATYRSYYWNGASDRLTSNCSSNPQPAPPSNSLLASQAHQK